MGRTPDPLSQANERIKNDRGTGHAHKRQTGVVVEEKRCVRQESDRLPQEVTHCLRRHLLDPIDVICCARHQAASCTLRKEIGRLR